MMSYLSSVNITAVIIAALVSMGIGFLWYSPLLFGKKWMKLMGLTQTSLKAAKRKMLITYSLSLIIALVTAYILSFIINVTVVTNLLEGFQLAVLIWLGFEAPVMISDILYGKRKLALFAINAGYQLVILLIMAGIVTYWT